MCCHSQVMPAPKRTICTPIQIVIEYATLPLSIVARSQSARRRTDITFIWRYPAIEDRSQRCRDLRRALTGGDRSGREIVLILREGSGTASAYDERNATLITSLFLMEFFGRHDVDE